MKYFFAELIVAVIDPISLVGYIVTALLSRHLWVAAALGMSWRLMLSLALDLRIGAGALVGAALMTALIYLAKRLIVQSKQARIPEQNDDDFDPGDPPEWSAEPTPSALDETQALASGVIAFRYREIAAANGSGTAPSRKTSDARIVEIYQIVTSNFRRVARERGEQLPATYTNYIAFYFMQINESRGPEFFSEHLEYELAKYRKEGLRATYRQEMELFPKEVPSEGVPDANAIQPPAESQLERLSGVLGSGAQVQAIKDSGDIEDKASPNVGKDDKLYEDALAEVEGPKRMRGRWARLYAEANGSESAAKAAYIRERVEEMRNAIKHQSKSPDLQ